MFGQRVSPSSVSIMESSLIAADRGALDPRTERE